jgi:hypothetical protein
MRINSIVKKATGLFILFFIVNCSPTLRNIEDEEQTFVSSSFMESCNTNNDPSMKSMCSCAESKIREQNASTNNRDSENNTNTTYTRGVSKGEMDLALNDCRKK